MEEEVVSLQPVVFGTHYILYYCMLVDALLSESALALSI